MHFKNCKLCGFPYKTPSKFSLKCWECRLLTCRNKHEKKYIMENIKKNKRHRTMKVLL